MHTSSHPNSEVQAYEKHLKAAYASQRGRRSLLITTAAGKTAGSPDEVRAARGEEPLADVATEAGRVAGIMMRGEEMGRPWSSGAGWSGGRAV